MVEKSHFEHWQQPIRYIVTNPSTPNRHERRHSKRRKRCDGNGKLVLGRL